MDVLLKRVCELKVKDIFKYMQVNYIVTKITKDKILYKTFYGNSNSGSILTFGVKNKMKVEIVKEYK